MVELARPMAKPRNNRDASTSFATTFIEIPKQGEALLREGGFFFCPRRKTLGEIAFNVDIGSAFP